MKIYNGPSDSQLSVSLHKRAIVRLEFHLKSDYEARVYFEDLTDRLNSGQALLLSLEGPTRITR
jgi:hypothetical protein